MSRTLRCLLAALSLPLMLLGALGSAEAPTVPQKPATNAGGSGMAGFSRAPATAALPQVTLGVAIADLSEPDKQFYKRTTGAVIESVIANTPAQRAGLLRNDLVIAFDNTPINVAADLPRMVQAAAPDKPHTLRIVRGGVEQDVTVNF